MSLAAGTRLGPYEVVAPIGAGGMGAVYEARDTRLGRTVAIKVLPEHLSADSDRRHRFEREAKAISSLNHPHVCTLYDIGSTSSPQAAGGQAVFYLVMEHLEGETLAERLRREAVPIRQMLDVGAQIADALDAAHKRGIIHRDLKPGNVMLTSAGVKLLDFGLAKLAEDDPPAAVSADPTRTAGRSLTDNGKTVGTVAYMSPEQATGEELDARSDLFSLGVVLYEMATRHQPFTGATTASVFDAILHKAAVPPVRLNPDVPADLERVIDKALEKDRDLRYQTAADLRGDLNRLKRDSDSGQRATTPARTPSGVGRIANRLARHRWVAWSIGGCAVVAAAGAVAMAVLGRRQAPPLPLPTLSSATQLTSAQGVEDYPSWSPDGQAIAYQSDQSGNWDIWVLQAGSKSAVNRTADSTVDDRFPSWSPDGLWIAFFSAREGGGYFLMPAVGGKAHKVAAWPAGELNPMTAAWSSDSRQIVYAMGQNGQPWFEILTLATGTSRRLPLPTSPRNNTVLDTNWSPDGRWLVYARSLSAIAETTELWLTRAADGESFKLTDGTKWHRSPTWSPDSRSFYLVSGRAGSSDVWRFAPGPKGLPEGVLQRVTTGLEVQRAVVSRDGTRLVLAKGRTVSNVFRAPLLAGRASDWADVNQLTSDDANYEAIDVSRDGRLVVSSDRSGNWDLWAMPAGGGEMDQLTMDPAIDAGPRWKPDGSEVVFHSTRTGHREIWLQPVGGGPPRQVTRGEGESYYPSWSPGGSELLFRRTRELFSVPARGGTERALTDTENGSGSSDWSPDGTSIVFRSYRGGPFRLYRVPASGGTAELLSERRQVGWPRWSRDGKLVYFSSGETTNNIWSLTVGTRQERPVTQLSGRRGRFASGLAVDDRFVYFLWEESRGDIWVADLVQPPAR